MKRTLDTNGAFHDGWLAYVLGDDKFPVPTHLKDYEAESWGEGYDMATETRSLYLVSATIRAMRKVGQLRAD